MTNHEISAVRQADERDEGWEVLGAGGFLGGTPKSYSVGYGLCPYSKSGLTAVWGD